MIPTFARHPIFKQEEFFSRNCTNGGFCDKARMLQGILNSESTNDEQLVFSTEYSEEDAREAREIINRGLTKVNGIYEPIVKFSVIPGSESDESLLGFKWNCTKVTN